MSQRSPDQVSTRCLDVSVASRDRCLQGRSGRFANDLLPSGRMSFQLRSKGVERVHTPRRLRNETVSICAGTGCGDCVPIGRDRFSQVVDLVFELIEVSNRSVFHSKYPEPVPVANARGIQFRELALSR
jgi:hypothetical protein